MIEVCDLNYQINDLRILNNIHLSLPKGQVIALIGPNGAGKSTLFSLMARLTPLQSGSVRFADFDIATGRAHTAAKTVAMLAQENHIQGRLRVRELLMFGRYPYHQGRPQDNDRQMVADIIARFELESLADRFLSTLSGGQRQRVLIAMVVCQDTPYILLDEPLNNLDMYHAGGLMRKMNALCYEAQKTVVIVLHDINHAAQFADTVVAMKQGEIYAVGAPKTVLTHGTIKALYNVDATILMHNDRPVIVDSPL